MLSRLLSIITICMGLLLPTSINLTPLYAQDDSEAGESQVQPQMNELMDTLVNLMSKKDKEKVIKEGRFNIRVDDLKTAISILQNKKEREQVVKALSALYALNVETEKREGIFQRASGAITTAIESSATVLLNLVGIASKAPQMIRDEIGNLSDEGHRNSIYSLLLTILIASIIAVLTEYFTRKIMHKFNIHRPKDITFRNLPIHVVRNVLPVLLFGLIGYGAVYFLQETWNDITYQGFIVMTGIIMLRTTWLVLRVLFSSKKTDVELDNGGMQNFSYQFTLAVTQIIIIGIVFAEMGSVLGMGDLAFQVWMRIIGFGVVSLLILTITKTRTQVASYFAFEHDSIHGFSLLLVAFIEFIGYYWNWIAGASLIISYILWVVNLDAISWFILSSLIYTAISSVLFVLGRTGLIDLHNRIDQKAKENAENLSVASVRYIEGSLGNLFQMLWHILFLVAILSSWGVDPLYTLANPAIQPHLTKVISALIIVLMARVLWLWVDYIAMNQLSNKKIGKRTLTPSQFTKTITPIVRSIARWVISIMSIVLILTEFGTDITPFVYGIAGIGIAISLGAQSLVKDLINGILTLMEGNIAVGEFVTIGANSGTIESMSLRGLTLRHNNGSIQTLPFSEVTNVINKSRDYASITIELNVAYKTDIAAVNQVLQATFKDMTEDAEFGKRILEPITISGVDRFTDNGMVVAATIKVKPDPKNRFIKAFNQKLKIHIEAAGVLPPPSQKILNVNTGG